MQVILLERVAKLGQMGEVVAVKDGYARNFLLPQGKALRATEANVKRFETESAQLEARNLEAKKEAEKVAAKLDGQTFVVIRSASDGGALYGSVTTRDVADAATEGGFTLDRRQVVLDQPIKELGLHPVTVALHPEVDATITLNVARSRRRPNCRPPASRSRSCGRGRGRGRVRDPGALRRHRRRRRRERPAADPLIDPTCVAALIRGAQRFPTPRCGDPPDCRDPGRAGAAVTQG